VLFGKWTKFKMDVFWENEEYIVPEKFISSVMWTLDRPNFAKNIREILADVPGFVYLKARFVEDEESMYDGGSVNRQGTLDTFVKFGENASAKNSKVDNKSDMPIRGAEWMAFESKFMRHTIWKNSTFDNVIETRPCSIKSKLDKVKSGVVQQYKKCSIRNTRMSKKEKTIKRTSLSKKNVNDQKSQRNKRRKR